MCAKAPNGELPLACISKLHLDRWVLFFCLMVGVLNLDIYRLWVGCCGSALIHFFKSKGLPKNLSRKGCFGGRSARNYTSTLLEVWYSCSFELKSERSLGFPELRLDHICIDQAPVLSPLFTSTYGDEDLVSCLGTHLSYGVGCIFLLKSKCGSTIVLSN